MSRTIAIVLTVVSVLCCACPGFGFCIAGVMGLAGVPFTTTIGDQTSVEPLSTPVAASLLCGALILILIPVAVGFFSFRASKAAASKAVPQGFNEPLPPAS